MAEIFKSSHKGTQIDEAVDRVLNNNCVIKWGNIIPSGLELQVDLWNELESKALKETTINSYSLAEDITLTAEDVQALPDTTIYGRTIDNSDMTIRLKDAEGNVISQATVPTMSGSDLTVVLNSKANLDLDNLSATGEAHFVNPSLNNLNSVGNKKFTDKLNVDKVASKGSGKDLLKFDSTGAAVVSTEGVGSNTRPCYLSNGTITQCGTSLDVSITGNAATATSDANGNNIASTYAKIDSSNMSATGKATVNGWGMPNWASRTAKTAGTQYKADKNGWIWICTNENDGSSYGAWQIYFGTSSASTGYQVKYVVPGTGRDNHHILVPVAKNWYYKTDNRTFYQYYFIPCIGG